MKRLFGIITTFSLIVGCTAVPEKKLLQFSVHSVRDVPCAEKISAEKVLLDTLDLTGFAVLGDKLIVTESFVSDYYLNVIDLASGDTRKHLCRKGRGPGEFLSVSPLFSVTDESVVVYDGGTGKVSEIYVVRDNVGDVAHQVKLEIPSGQSTPIISSLYKVSEKELVAFNSIQAPIESVSIESPYYAVFDNKSGVEKRAFHLFDATPLAHSSEWVSTTAFDLRDCINSKNTTVCFAMGTMPVFGFLDIASGIVKGFRFKGEPHFSVKENRLFFSGVCAQGQYVYSLYLGKTGNELRQDARTTLYKLDWEGHVLKKYELDGLYQGCRATPDRLYLSRVEDDQTWGLYQLDIKIL